MASIKALRDRAFEVIDRESSNVIKLLMDMISIPTISPEGDNYIEFSKLVAEFLSSYGISSEIHRIPLEYTDPRLPDVGRGKPRYVVIARIGDPGKVIIHFNGHYDVVSGGPGWRITEPFKPRVVGDRVYGRGSSDMKGGIASIVLSMIALQRSAESLGHGVEAFLVPDEEIGGETGTQYVVENNMVRGRYIIIAEPTGLERIYIGQKGRIRGLIVVRGRSAHGASPWLGVNAFEKASRLAVKMFDELVPRIEAKRSRYRYDYEEASKATLMIGGLLRGGDKINQVPGEVIFSLDRRLIVEENVDEAWSEIKAYVEDVARSMGIDLDLKLILAQNPAVADENSRIFAAIEASLAEVTGIRPGKVVCYNGLDMIYYLQRGYEAATYGPGGYGTPHAPDEYIEIGDILKASKIYVDTYFRFI
ncbi:MAG: M20 family metallopeptidase [Desulfurococcales archaeon]|nr:M20 family metallopeptidase [Desulfurococcales archaeon]